MKQTEIDSSMERRVFVIYHYEDDYWINKYKSKSIKDGFISVGGDGYGSIHFSAGIKTLNEHGWTAISLTEFRYDFKHSGYLAVYAEKQSLTPEQKCYILDSDLDHDTSHDEDIITFTELNTLLSQGWRIKDSIFYESHFRYTAILLEKSQEDTLSAEQQYLDRVKAIIAEKGRLRTSDLAELQSLRERLGISAERAEEIEDMI